ncbi:MAG: NADPH:quinone reductase [Rhodospirillales bacterium]
MKAAFYRAHGAARDVLEIGQLPDPQAGPGQVLVRIAVSGINPSDVKTRQGTTARPFDGVRIPHNDGAGEIVAVGQGVDTARIGQRVWVHNTGASNVLGTAAELVAVPQNDAAKLPDNIGFEEAACFGVPLLTACHGVTAAGPVEGKIVLVTGGAGAVGHYAVQLATALGATVIASVSSEEKAAVAREAGARHIVDYRTEDVPARIRDITEGRGVDHVVEVNLTVNGPTLHEILAVGGSAAIYGSDGAEVTLNARFLRIQLAALHFYNVYALPETVLAAAKAALLPILETGALKTRIAGRFDLDDIVAAHEAVESGELVGNAVVRVTR